MKKNYISWTEQTWNTVSGCTKLGKECKNCYAKIITDIRKNNPTYSKYEEGFDKVVEHKETLNEPYQWKEPTVVFVNSMSDLFHDDVSLDFIKAVFKVMNETPQHTYQVLTKRSQNLLKYSNQLNWTDNIWAGVSVGINDTRFRIDDLRQCGSKHKFISVEPLIEEINDLDLNGIDWVIVGGESGSEDARPLEYDWVIKIKDICEQQNVPFFFKQWGMPKNNPDLNDPTLDKNHPHHTKGGCMLDGKIYWNNPSNPDQIVKTIKLFDVDHYVIDEYEELKTIWELQTYLPEMEEVLYVQLKDDIKENGLNDPILYVIINGNDRLVIEGHTRLKAVKELKINTFPTKEIANDFESIDDIKLWMMKHQFQRRNLSPAEKLNLAFLSKTIIEKKAKENLSRAGQKIEVTDPIDTNTEIGKIAGISKATVVRYSRVLREGPKQLKNDMLKGNITISAAEKTLKNTRPIIYKKIKDIPQKELITEIGEESELLPDEPLIRDDNPKPIEFSQSEKILDEELSGISNNNDNELNVSGHIKVNGETTTFSSLSEIENIIEKIKRGNPCLCV